MSEPLRTATAQLLRGEAPLGVLALLGVAHPERCARALSAAVGHPSLRDGVESWLPALLVTARPDFAASTLVDLAERAPERLTREALPHLVSVLGSSSTLGRVLLRHPDWIADLAAALPPAPALEPVPLDWMEIRRAKYRGLLRVVARDLAGREFGESPRELSDLADGCLLAALALAHQEAPEAELALFALGKLGGCELNFSSDVDLLFLYPALDERHDVASLEGVTRVVRVFKTRLEERTEEGFGYRVDLDLRPQGKAAPLAHSLPAALTYYESFGRDWERQMLIRLRPLAGSPKVLEAFPREIAPFVYRGLIDPDAIASVRAMKARIERERRASGVDLENSVKEARGAIRDVEFVVQALQLFVGGRDPAARTGNVLEALGALESARALAAPVVTALQDCYLWLRRCEHALQLDEERQTARFPTAPRAQLGLARRMGYHDVDGERARLRLIADWDRVRAEVGELFGGLVLRDVERTPTTVGRARPEQVLEEALAASPLRERLHAHAEPLVERAGDALLRLDLSPEVAAGLARMLAANAEAARYLARRPAVLDRLPSLVEGADLEHVLGDAPAPPVDPRDLEPFLDELRLLRRDAFVLLACADLGGVLPFERVSALLARVAEQVLASALAAARSALAGEADVDFSILGFGKLAGRELTYHSDLDLIFLCEGDADALASASRIAHKLIHYLSTSTGAGTAYAIDARLRPSGRQGALVSTYEAYASYQREQARTWEHLALMRARAVAGRVEHAQQVLEDAQAHVRAQGERPWRAIAELRERIAAERAREAERRVAFKTGPGGIMDVDFLATGAQLERGPDAPLPRPPSVPALLASALTSEVVEQVLESYRFLRVLEGRARFVAGRPVEAIEGDAQGLLILAELMEPGLAPSQLLEGVQHARARIQHAVDRVLDSGTIRALAD